MHACVCSHQRVRRPPLFALLQRSRLQSSLCGYTQKNPCAATVLHREARKIATCSGTSTPKEGEGGIFQPRSNTLMFVRSSMPTSYKRDTLHAVVCDPDSRLAERKDAFRGKAGLFQPRCLHSSVCTSSRLPAGSWNNKNLYKSTNMSCTALIHRTRNCVQRNVRKKECS